MMFSAFFFPSLLCYLRVFGHFVCIVLAEKRELGRKCYVGLLKLGRKRSRRKMVIFSNIGLLHMRRVSLLEVMKLSYYGYQMGF